ncbi:MAG: hypothetical protein A2W71_03060 [Candidatus Nealsonbacteria bacterium RIFCSPLOWO2_02_39_8]|uniref:Uncharacterized protein n=4 Tax=Parcubacteria group TaxID=1794811 RepID=A0A1G2EGY4_9BACT|nr:MAG: hypothetical protein UU83_C0013G0015 [Candidatus Jorgensenbacteria bacterium GW2011_GWF2_41_8]KKS96848.1 MAG: hypothetical protein UV72_C0001G0147 [Candidatus Giovannonibacteria bacterium GW2011_GWB1_43_13]KKS99650.1 MAG: hypothetical protein UV75_C0002G0031 [Candidatus Giovannonibacteria bacterium GW2011_GWA1_43_15]KKT21492.1 MAG: hypothetical protein UW05_C0009G0026 [Candidatus Giovannonibacteria bacterium GW2011_GWC2_43_8]KKT63735.1 MAG: hypothetical protein UW55_C0001G0028 [Candidat
MGNSYKFILFGLTIIFISLIFYGFPDSPAPWFDEGINLGIVKSWLKHGVYSLEIGPSEFIKERSLLITTNYPLLLWIALSFKFFGIGLWQAKIVMFGFLFIFACLFYLLAKKYYGANSALMTLALLITFLPLYGNGKSALGEIPGLTYFLGGLLFWESEKKWRIFTAGLLFGLAAATKPLYLLLIVSVAIGELWIFAGDRKSNYKRWVLLASGFAPPLILWLYTLLPGQLSFDYLIKTWQLYSNPYNIENTAFVNFLRFFKESTPVHFGLLFGAFLFSKIFVKHYSLKKFEVILLAFIVLNLLFYLKTAGWYRYFFPAHILLFMLFPQALAGIMEKFGVLNWIKTRGSIILIAILAVVQAIVLVVNIQTSLYLDRTPRQFAEAVNKIVPQGQGILVIDFPEIVFLLNRDDVWHYLRANPHITFGRDLFAANQYPAYVISDVLPPGNKYDIKIDGGKYVLYERKK